MKTAYLSGGSRVAEREYVCNACGRKLSVKNGILREDALIIKKEWGYFSHKDLEVHEIILCEECYDKMIEGFAIPVKEEETTELL